jgi:hypothetical protein
MSFVVVGDVEIGFLSSFDRVRFGGSILADVDGIEGDEAGLCNICPPLAPDFFANQVVTVGGLTVLGSSDFNASITVDGNLTVANSTLYGGYLDVSTEITVDGQPV